MNKGGWEIVGGRFRLQFHRLQRAQRGMWRRTTMAVLAAIFASVFSAFPIEAETDDTCHPRLETEFRSILIEATEKLDFRLLHEAFGPGLEQLVGLECDPRIMRAILEDAGYRVFGGGSGVVGYLPDQSLWGRLRNRRSAQAEVEILDGVITGFSIGPIK